MTKKTGFGLTAALCCAMASGMPAMAQPTAPGVETGQAEMQDVDRSGDMHGGIHGHDMPGMRAGKAPMRGAPMEGPHGSGHGHGAMASWQATLTDDQKAEIGLSKLRLRQKQSLVEARIALKKAEIAQIVAADDSSDARLLSAVDELMTLERARTLDHYRHLMEVRQLLTPRQRLSFDLGLVSGDGHGQHGGGHGH